jgi:hypothetical protein
VSEYPLIFLASEAYVVTSLEFPEWAVAQQQGNKGHFVAASPELFAKLTLWS